MAENNGWVKIHRSLMDKAYYGKPEYLAMWVHLLLKASHQEYEVFFNGEIIKLKPGQLITGRKVLAQDTGIHASKVERILKVFQNQTQIEQRTSPTSRLISILNWDKFQAGEQESNNKRTTSEQRMNNGRTTSEHKQEGKEYKEGKEGKEIKRPTPDEFLAYCKSLPIDYARLEFALKAKYDRWIEDGWKDGHGKKITNWKNTIRSVIPYLKPMEVKSEKPKIDFDKYFAEYGDKPISELL